MKQDKLHSGRRFFKKTDLLVVTLLVTAALMIWGYLLFYSDPNQQLSVEIYSDDSLVETVNLPSSRKEVSIPNKEITIEINGRKAHVLETDCPDQTCLKSGSITRAGQSIICLPNRVVVKVVSTKGEISSGVDAVAG